MNVCTISTYALRIVMDRTKLKKKIKERYCTYSELSIELGKDSKYISDVLRGKQGIPSSVGVKLADLLGMSVDELYRS